MTVFTSLTVVWGRLEIFWKGKWSTSCGVNRAAAEIACNQIGYSMMSRFYPYSAADYTKEHIISKASDDVPIGFIDINCGYDYRSRLQSHPPLLRCDYTVDDIPSIRECSHENDTILECSILSDRSFGYSTQVRLVSGPYPSSGTLEIYLNFAWGNVCNTKFNEQAADSVCRQMGYTNALAFNSTKTKSAAVVGLMGWNVALSRVNASTVVSNPQSPTSPVQVVSTSLSTAHLMSG